VGFGQFLLLFILKIKLPQIWKWKSFKLTFVMIAPILEHFLPVQHRKNFWDHFVPCLPSPSTIQVWVFFFVFAVVYFFEMGSGWRLDLRSSCLNFPSAGIIGVHHHTQLSHPGLHGVMVPLSERYLKTKILPGGVACISQVLRVDKEK
jgi:hypothetical protein